MINYDKIKYFTAEEMASPDDPNTGYMMDWNFMLLLDKAREIAGISFKITSGYRSYEHNKKVGGRLGSSHCKGLAADIAATNSQERGLIMKGLYKAGFTRIGLDFERNFIHVDLDDSKALDVLWGY
jgi:zinc D-Ala-D-Ala carboxypeptidase